MSKQKGLMIVFTFSIFFITQIIFLVTMTEADAGDSIWKMTGKNFTEWYLDARWMLCNNGTPGNGSDDMVLDKKTGLIWARYANLGQLAWLNFISDCRTCSLGNRKGWRPPTVEELASLLGPTGGLPTNHPFMDVQTAPYWTITTYWDVLTEGQYASTVNLNTGNITASPKEYLLDILPVYGGNGYASGNW